MKEISFKKVFNFENCKLETRAKRNIIGGIDPNGNPNSIPFEDDFPSNDPSDPQWGGPGSSTTSSSTSYSTVTNNNGNNNPIIPISTSN